MSRSSLGALTLLAAFALPLAASAQTAPALAPPPAGAHAHRHHHHHASYLHALRGLNLSATQRQQIAVIARANERELRTKIDGVLTDAQKAQLRSKAPHAPHAPQ
jgi:Spy/CpxP family protein refolding chaperone